MPTRSSPSRTSAQSESRAAAPFTARKPVIRPSRRAPYDRKVTFLPLDGVRVLDVTSSLAGPYCTEILGALGAGVVKVERPDGGDETRAWWPLWDGEGVMFLCANAGKRSLALDLSDQRGLEALHRLAEGADVFVQSLRPGVAERRGLGVEALRARNPRLVYCSIGSFGNPAPPRAPPGYD